MGYGTSSVLATVPSRVECLYLYAFISYLIRWSDSLLIPVGSYLKIQQKQPQHLLLSSTSFHRRLAFLRHDLHTFFCSVVRVLSRLGVLPHLNAQRTTYVQRIVSR